MEYLRKRCGVSFTYTRQESLPEVRDRSLSPSGTLRGLEWGIQPAQSAIIGLPVSYRTYRRDTPPALTVVHGQAKKIEVVGRKLFSHGSSLFSRF